MLPPAAIKFYAVQQRVNAITRVEALRIWSHMGDDFDASWARYGPALLNVLMEGQSQVAAKAASYVPDVLAELGLRDIPQGDVVPSSFVGVASDGRPLESLAYGAVTTSKGAVADGATPQQALRAGSNFVDVMSRLQVADAARQVVSAGTAIRTNLGGTIRVLNPPSCSRCAILAGRFYRWSTGFERHPGCDCVNMPAEQVGWAKAEGFVTDPMDAYKAGQIKDLTRAQVAAIDNGADIGQVVNATRGMSTTRLTTAEATTRRGLAGKRLNNFAKQPGSRYSVSQTPRLTPEAIYRLASSREEAIALLRAHGYIK